MLEVFITLSVAAILINSFFIGIIWIKPKVTAIHQHYLTNLTTCNLFVSCLCLMYDVLSDQFPLELPRWLCVMPFYGIQIGIYSAMGTVVTMSIDKCIGVGKPMLYKTLCTIRNTRLALCLVNLSAIAFSLLPTGDFLDYLSHNVCTVILYPRRYGMLIIATVLLLYLLALISTFIILVVLIIKFIKTHTTVTRLNTAIVVKARRGTRIILCTIVAYTLAITPLIAFSFWLSDRSVDLEYIFQHDFAVVALCSPIIISYFDPIVYVICVFGFRKISRVSPAQIGSQVNETVPNSNRILSTCLELR